MRAMSSDESKIHIPTPQEMEALNLSPREKAEQRRGQPPESEQPAPESEADQLLADCQMWKERALRAVADYQNLQRRSQEEQAATARYALADFVKSLLPIIDDLERTLEAANEAADRQSLREGVQLIYENLMKLLQAHRVERIIAEGEPFDPACHESILAEPRDDKPDKTVIREVARGYRLADRVLRPSKVVISQAPRAAGAQPDAEGEPGGDAEGGGHPPTGPDQNLME